MAIDVYQPYRIFSCRLLFVVQMKQVRFAQSVAVLLEDSVKKLVEKNYFSEE